jgi:serine protease Do
MRRTIALLLLAVLTIGGCKRPPAGERAAPDITPQAPLPIEAPPTAPGAVNFQNGFAPVVERVRGAVVNISTTKVIRPPGPEQAPFFSNPLFRDFFGRGMEPPRARREQSLGSGVLVSKDGYVLTNSHVVHGASEVLVSLPDRRELKARIIGADPKTDIALLRIPGDDFTFARFGDSSRVRVGEFALAIGDPLGLGQTVTFGIISATGRGNVGIVDYEDFLQTDAAINPGNSGGALVNTDGELIGIPTAIATTGGGQGNQGIGFAVPSNLAREVMRQIEQRGRVIRGWLGVAVQDVTPTMAAALGLEAASGALVSDVTEGSPAAKAGLARGDVVVAMDGKPVVDSRSLRMHVAETSPGTRIGLSVWRDRRRLEVSAVLGEMPAGEPRPPSTEPSPATALGMRVAPLTPDAMRALGVPEGTTGVVVAAVQPGSRAEAAGLRPGDVIQEVDRKRVRSPDELRRATEVGGPGPLLVLVLRGGHTHYVAIPRERPGG